MRISLLIVGSVVVAAAAHGQVAVRPDSSGGAVSGVVYDSLRRAPLRDARVQIVAADRDGADARLASTDSLGRFRFDSVGSGRYFVGFFHPLLDSLALEPIVREVVIREAGEYLVPLAIPAGPRLRDAFCGAGRTSGGALVGVVRGAADGQPVERATVTAEWMELSFGRGAPGSRPGRVSATTTAEGWFVLCGVPSPGNVGLRSGRDADSSDMVDVAVPAEGFVRRELYLGSARELADARADSASPVRRSGDGRLQGRVTTVAGRPIAGAIVGIQRAAQARTDSTGTWTLDRLPSGTRILDVRAIGFYPERRAIDVVPGSPPVQTVLETFESVLDTVRIRATGYTSDDQGGFEERRKSLGTGRFISEQEIMRRGATFASDLFRMVPGVKVEPDIKMRGAFANLGTLGECTPNLFLNGRSMPTMSGAPLTPEDLDMWVRPVDIMGIEVYPDAPPPQFQVPLSGCGSIVIWTKRRRI